MCEVWGVAVSCRRKGRKKMERKKASREKERV